MQPFSPPYPRPFRKMPVAFHLLPEYETLDGGYLSPVVSWLANVASKEPDTVIVAAERDCTCRIPEQQVRVVSALRTYRSLLQGGAWLLPQSLRSACLARIFSNCLRDLSPGDTVWAHDSPECAGAIDPYVKSRGARLFVHIHHPQLLGAYPRQIRQTAADCYILNDEAARREVLAKYPMLSRTEVLTVNSAPRGRSSNPAVAQTRSEAGNSPVVALSARLAYDSTFTRFVEAARILRRRSVNARAVILLGPGDIAGSRLQELQAQSPSAITIESFNSTARLRTRLREVDVLCVPSTWHQVASMPLLEALACGLTSSAIHPGGLASSHAADPKIMAIPATSSALADLIELAIQQDPNHSLAPIERENAETPWVLQRSRYRSLLDWTSRPAAFPKLSDSALLHA